MREKKKKKMQVIETVSAQVREQVNAKEKKKQKAQKLPWTGLV